MALLTALGALGAGGAAAAGTGAAAAVGAAAVGAAGSLAGTLGSVASLAGTAAGVAGEFMQQKAAKEAESLRKRQMNLEAARERRDIVRKSIIARSEALSAATASGAQYGSGLPGAIGGITSEQGQGMLAVNQNQEIGRKMFAANADMARGQTVSSFGSGLQGLGSNLSSNMDLYGRLGAYYFGGR